MSTKIQINCLKALETLLGADPEFEVEFRNAVVAELHRKIIVPIVDKRVQSLVETEVNHALGTADRYGGQIKLAPRIADAIEGAVRAEASRVLVGVTEQIVKEVLNKETIKANVIHSATVRAVEEYKAKIEKAIR